MKSSRKMWSISLAAAAAIAVLSADVTAQDNAQSAAMIRRTVTDSVSSQPVVGGQVVAEGTTRRPLTDSSGAYTMRALRAVSTTLSEVMITGYGTQEQSQASGAATMSEAKTFGIGPSPDSTRIAGTRGEMAR